MFKKSASGLATIKRDFSDAPAASSQDWPPSPPPKSIPLKVETPSMTPAERRLKNIQDAIAGSSNFSSNTAKPLLSKRPSPSNTLTEEPQPKKARPLPSSSSEPLAKQSSSKMMTSANRIASKNAFPEVATITSSSNTLTEEPLPKKARQLPSSWSEPAKQSSSRIMTSANRIASKNAFPEVATITSTATKRIPKIFLSEEQKEIISLVQKGDSIFYTGSAGTGKSVLLREIIKTLKERHIKSTDAVAITASTGIAACNIGGVTIHSFAGIGLGIESHEQLTSKIRKNKKASTRWLRTKVLIIDEVSMVDGDLFDKLAHIGSTLRKNTLPFGGIQVIVTGDFFQLPPVTRGNTEVKFAFEATTWPKIIKRTFNLTQVFRQKDQEFVDMLNEMRFGQLSKKSIAKFHSLKREIRYDDGLGATELFPRREDVERSNFSRMRNLQTEELSFRAIDGGTVTDLIQREKMLSNLMAPSELKLRINCQVMLIKNVDETLVNGSMGKVIRFADVDMYGQEMLEAGGVVDSTAAASGSVKPPSKKGSSPKIYPVVEFLVPGGTRTVLVNPETWKTELPNGEIQVSRTQLPLILAWAMSIHKSQGQTLDRVRVDLGKVFEKGQAYVALSRATSMQGLQVLNFNADKVKVHPKVVSWSLTLETVTKK